MIRPRQCITIICVLLLIGVTWCSRAGDTGGRTAAKTRSITIPNLELEDVAFNDVIYGLQAESRRLDPDREGVNFMFNFDPEKAHQARERRITLSFRNLSLGDVIRYVCMAAGLHYVIETHAIIIVDKSIPLENMETRFYAVPAGVIDTTPTRQARELEWRD